MPSERQRAPLKVWDGSLLKGLTTVRRRRPRKGTRGSDLTKPAASKEGFDGRKGGTDVRAAQTSRIDATVADSSNAWVGKS